jgi:hypothetical protein
VPPGLGAETVGRSLQLAGMHLDEVAGERYPQSVGAMRGLPGEELVRKGLSDLKQGRESVEALLVSIGAPRLKGLGFRVPSSFPAPEHRLYTLLAAEDSDSAHSRYNALVRRLVSFERATACVS